MNNRMNLGPAATRLCHLAAIAMHGTAASELFVRHRTFGHTGQHRRCGYQQQEQRNEAGETAHPMSISAKLWRCDILIAERLRRQLYNGRARRPNTLVHSAWDDPAQKDDPKALAAAQAIDLRDTGRQVAAFERQAPSAHVVRMPNADHDVFRSNEADVLREMNAFINALPKE